LPSINGDTMGRIKTRLIKRVSIEIFKAHKDELKGTFKENRELVSKYTDTSSKKLRNIMAGYLTRLNKTKED